MAPGIPTAREIVPRASSDSSQPNLPGFCPAVYPVRPAAHPDCLSRTRHLLEAQAGTLDAHFVFLGCLGARDVPSRSRWRALQALTPGKQGVTQA